MAVIMAAASPGTFSRMEEMRPFLGGGDMIREVSRDAVSYADPPMKFEAGTPGIVSTIGLGVALDYMMGLGMENISAGTAGMLVGSGPIFTALVARFILKERLTGVGWIGLAIGFAGITVIAFGSAGASLTLNTGALLVIVASFASAVFFVFQKPLLGRY